MKFNIVKNIEPIEAKAKVNKFSSLVEQYPTYSEAERKIIASMKDAFNMTKQRCYNPNAANYDRYGARGIKICDSWLENFNNLLNDMGLRPGNLTLERKNNNKDYCKENCVWASRKDQTRNREDSMKLTYNGETKTIAEWSEITGIDYSTLKARLRRLAYTPEQVLQKSVKSGARPNA